jgi:hypothetical protein
MTTTTTSATVKMATDQVDAGERAVPFTMASQKILVVLDEPRVIELRDGRRVQARYVQISDGYADVPMDRYTSGTRTGRTVYVTGPNVRTNDELGRRVAAAYYRPGHRNDEFGDGPMPGWLAQVVDAAIAEHTDRVASEVLR